MSVAVRLSPMSMDRTGFVDGVLVNGVDIIKWNDGGQIVEFKVMLRPLRAINVFHQRMAAMLQSTQPAP